MEIKVWKISPTYPSKSSQNSNLRELPERTQVRPNRNKRNSFLFVRNRDNMKEYCGNFRQPIKLRSLLLFNYLIFLLYSNYLPKILH
uniref:Ovule protein n=1 Tax=Parascaris univalens TaxID=6257 RepID=A0A914ZU83_PARUN